MRELRQHVARDEVAFVGVRVAGEDEGLDAQRCVPAVHVITQHASVSAGSLELAGRALLGVDGDYSIL